MAATLLWRVVAGMSPLKLKDGAVGHKECVVLWLGIPSSKSNHDSTSPSLSLRGFEMTSCRVLQAPGSSMCGRAAAAEDPAPLILGNTTGVKDEDDIDDAGELSSFLARDMSGGGLPMNSLKLLLLVFAPPLYGAGEEGALPEAPLSALPPTPSFLPTPMDSIVLLCCRSCRTAAACMSACIAAAPLARECFCCCAHFCSKSERRSKVCATTRSRPHLSVSNTRTRTPALSKGTLTSIHRTTSPQKGSWAGSFSCATSATAAAMSAFLLASPRGGSESARQLPFFENPKCFCCCFSCCLCVVEEGAESKLG
mmetsp:Transcript_60857/g.122110  ORF Transcript_60857/g.122110 Transcript_60857/m.122110 type:complete len:311 (-) Transcript_60857:224-1156(-)